MNNSCTGTLVALATPFRDGGSAIDTEALQRLVNHCIEGGVDGLVPCGTTGESPTLSHAEHDLVIEHTIEAAAGRVPIIAGAGSNSTAEAVRLSRHAAETGAAGILSVVPYYNKPNQAGMERHFGSIADACPELPIVLYDIPGRSVVGMEIPTLRKLAERTSIVAIKEATGNVDRVGRIRRETGLAVLSGDDSLTLPMLALGAEGVVSVLANLLPKPVSDMVRAARTASDFVAARELHDQLEALMNVMFVEPNPVPIKAALEQHGLCSSDVRLPLVGASTPTRELLKSMTADFDTPH